MMRRSPFVLLLLVLLAGLAPAPRAAERLGYYRFPAIHGDTVVFCAEGDLFQVSIQGGVARRLTTHLANESRPSVSPDGKTIAFSASYEGPTEVYTMPSDGGLPVRHTYEGGNALVVGWTPESKVLYATQRYSTLPETQLLTLDPKTGEKSRIPLAQASDGSFDASTGTLYFTRYAYQGSHTKRYKGGTAQNVWKLPRSAAEAQPLTADFAGTSKAPMVWKGRIYFASDRDGTMNLWSMTLDGKDLKQLTRHVGFDVKDPSLSNGRIAYQLGADLRVHDVEAGTDRAIPITLVSDFDQMREKWIKKPVDYLTAVHLSPDGDRLVLTARGQVFVAPVKQGRFVEARRKSGVRYRQARFLSGGSSVVAISDESGETEWWKLSATGLEGPERLTKDGKVLRFDGVPSPDGKWIAHYDQDQELWLTSVDSKDSRKIDFSPYWGYEGLAWSADSRWLAYSRSGDNLLNRVYLYEVGAKTLTAVTSDRYDSYTPVFSPDGKWLYFLSDRAFRSTVGSPWGSRQPEPFFDQSTKILFLGLRDGLRSPFEPDDELHKEDKKKEEEEKKKEADKDKEKDKDKKKDDKDAKPAKVEIALAGIEERLFEVPVPPGNHGGLGAAGDRLYWLTQENAREPKLKLMTLVVRNTEIEPKTMLDGAASYEISADGKKMLVRKGDDLHVVDAAQDSLDSSLAKGKVDLSSWTFPIDPREEWRQIFVESWRLERDYFYDRSMHGVDWKAVLDRYLPLVDRVTNRLELADLQAQMAGELSALHTFVGPGDLREGQDDVDPASLGALLERDERAGGFRVARIYTSDPDRPGEASPLSRPGVDVREGDVIESVDGVATLSTRDLGSLLRQRAGKQVRLKVKPKAGGARDVIVTPLSTDQEFELRYTDWELSRRKAVDEKGAGKIGYLHLRAMGRNDIAQWHRDFYPVFDREGLIVDVRHNRGGNIDSWILARLLRRPWFWWQPRVGAPYSNMQFAFRGHVVVLIDAFTASDGEAFAEGFRRLGLGKLIGTRTWGGEIWLSSSNTLVDKGIVTAAEFGVYGPEGEWLIEGHGVEPDIVVDNLPGATFTGKDAQLDAAIEHLQKLIRDEPRPKPPAPKYPNKSLPPPK